MSSPPRNFRANRAKSALTVLLFLSLALTSAFLMRGHANLEDPAPNDNGENNDQETPDDMLTPQDGWESWMPEASIDNDPNTHVTLTFTAKVGASDEGSIDFGLSSVTSYEGRYMNDKTKQGDTSADLYFAKCKDQMPITDADGKKVGTWKGGGKDSLTITASWWEQPATNDEETIEIPVKIVCNDFAAYGELQARLNVPEEEPVDSKIHTIPKDDGSNEIHRWSGTSLEGVAGNKLADEWDRDHLYWYMSSVTPDSGAASRFTEGQLFLDRDEGYDVQNEGSDVFVPQTGIRSNRSGANSGDGLTVLEEYRGFMVGGSYTRLHPEIKDLFIYSQVDGGNIGYSSGLGLAVHSITEDECISNGDSENPPHDPDPPLVNFCSVDEEETKELTAVWVVPLVYQSDIEFLGDNKHSYGFTKPSKKRSVIIEDRRNTDAELAGGIGHEVGHAIGLGHHSSRRVFKMRALDAQGVMRDWARITFPTSEADACVMNTDEYDPNKHLSITDDEYNALMGSGWANFHSTPPFVEADGEYWEDHWHVHRLHSNHEGHLPYDYE